MNRTDQILRPRISQRASNANGNVVADIDKDARKGIIAAVGSRGLSVLRQYAAGIFDARLLMQRGNPDFLAVGDFDGERVPMCAAAGIWRLR